MVSNKNKELQWYNCLLKGNYAKGIKNLKTLLGTESVALEFIKSPGVCILFELQIAENGSYIHDFNSAALLEVLKASGYYDPAAKSYLAMRSNAAGYEEMLASRECMSQVAYSHECLNAIFYSLTLFEEMVRHETAANILLASSRMIYKIGRNTQMLAVIASSETARNALQQSPDVTNVYDHTYALILGGVENPNEPSWATIIVDQGKMKAAFSSLDAVKIIARKNLFFSTVNSSSSAVAVAAILGNIGGEVVRILANSAYWKTTLGSNDAFLSGLVSTLESQETGSSIDAINSKYVFLDPGTISSMLRRKSVALDVILLSTVPVAKLDSTYAAKTNALLVNDTSFAPMIVANKDFFRTAVDNGYLFNAIATSPIMMSVIASDKEARDILAASSRWRGINSGVPITLYILALLGRNPEEFANIKALLTDEAVMTQVYANDTALSAMLASTVAVSALGDTTDALINFAAKDNAINTILKSAGWTGIGENNLRITRYILALLGRDPAEFTNISNLLANETVIAELVASDKAMQALANSKVAMTAFVGNANSVTAAVASEVAMNAIATSINALDIAFVNISFMTKAVASEVAMNAIVSSGVAINKIVEKYNYTMPQIVSTEIAISAVMDNPAAMAAVLESSYAGSYMLQNGKPLRILLKSSVAKDMVVGSDYLKTYTSYIIQMLTANKDDFDVYKTESLYNPAVKADIVGEDLIVVARISCGDSGNPYISMFHGHNPAKLVARHNGSGFNTNSIGIGGAVFSAYSGQCLTTVYKAKP